MLSDWLDSNNIPYDFVGGNIFCVPGMGNFLFVEEKENFFDERLKIQLSPEEASISGVDYYCFKFGEWYYYSPDTIVKDLTPLKYIGSHDPDFSKVFLGVHGGYELLNGSRSYSDWIRKAKMLGYSTLGIVEKNTLSGILKFQIECNKNGIKPIIGEQVCVMDGDDILQFKIYARDFDGWKNLLRINREINVINNGFVDKKIFLEDLKGLYVVVDTKYTPYDKVLPYSINVPDMFYQVDSVVFDNMGTDKSYLLNLKKYYSHGGMRPVMISDAYYLDKDDGRVKSILNMIGSTRDLLSSCQYFKSNMEEVSVFSGFFDDMDDFLGFITKSIKNREDIGNGCVFELSTDLKYLPQYKMTGDEVTEHGDKMALFWSIVNKGLADIPNDKDYGKYKDRVREEFETISLVDSGYGNGIDYFLISWDIVRFCHENGILVGVGRGSSAGSLIAYLMGITKIDPFEYNLLFSRFLNKGRVEKGSLPDFDIDFQAEKRGDVKKYIEDKYGVDHVCSVGTYTTLQLRAALKDISRQRGLDFSYVNSISAILEGCSKWWDIFEIASSNKKLKKFVYDNPSIVQDIHLVLGQPKSRSIHACAMIITPEGMPVHECFPVRSEFHNGEEMVVTEWEGGELEKAGFLKMDILGIKQLDKYRFIIDLIKEQTGDVVDIYNIPLDTSGVYELFKEGNNGDVFHFGSHGLTGYCKDLKPNNIHELIAGISLYRPGAMDVNAHNEYVLRKSGERGVKFHWGTENVLKDTYGLIVYQEQVMGIVSELAEFTIIESDDIRRGLGKKIKEEVEVYKDRFMSVVIRKGCPKEEAEEIWHELEVHSGYSFNKSHAASYAITGYMGQWLKYNYPLQYWTAAFQYDDPDVKKSNINRYMSEIRCTDSFIKIVPPDINESGWTFTSNNDKMELYWSIDRIAQIGNVTLNSIMDVRNEGGKFFSLEDFLHRVPKKSVNKSAVINLILSGAFDDIEGIRFENDRSRLIKKYYEFSGHKANAMNDPYLINTGIPYWWQLSQKIVSGFGNVDFRSMVDKMAINGKYCSGAQLMDKDPNKEVVVAGLIKSLDIKRTKGGLDFCKLVIDNNSEDISIVLWNDLYVNIDKSLLLTGKVIAFHGRVVEYNGFRSVHSMDNGGIYFL